MAWPGPVPATGSPRSALHAPRLLHPGRPELVSKQPLKGANTRFCTRARRGLNKVSSPRRATPPPTTMRRGQSKATTWQSASAKASSAGSRISLARATAGSGRDTDLLHSDAGRSVFRPHTGFQVPSFCQHCPGHVARWPTLRPDLLRCRYFSPVSDGTAIRKCPVSAAPCRCPGRPSPRR